MRENIAGVRGVGMLDGVGEGEERKEGSFSSICCLFVSLLSFPYPLEKLYTQAKNIKKSYGATTLTIQIKGIMQCQQKSRLSQSASGKKNSCHTANLL